MTTALEDLSKILSDLSNRHAEVEYLKKLIDFLKAAANTDKKAEIAVMAIQVGAVIGIQKGIDSVERTLRSGFATVLGGKKSGATRKREFQETQKKAKDLYKKRSAENPKIGRMGLLLMVGDELGRSPKTIGNMVRNPKPNRRGRPHKR